MEAEILSGMNDQGEVLVQVGERVIKLKMAGAAASSDEEGESSMKICILQPKLTLKLDFELILESSLIVPFD